MTVKISGIFARGEDSVCVCFELKDGDAMQSERKRLFISAGQMAKLGLSRGECNEELYETVVREAKLYEANRRAMRSLEYGSRSKKSLALKLTRSGVDRDIAIEAVDQVYDMGLLDDDDNACREAERALRKLWGKRRIEAELYKKGYGSESVRAALKHLDRVGADYVANCKVLISQKIRSDSPSPNRLKNIYAALVRYGYTSGEIREALGAFTDK